MGVLIFIVIIVFINIRKHQVFYSSAMELTDLPKFEAVDAMGTKIKRSNLKDKNLFIQFINSKFQPDIDLFESVYSNWIDEDIYFLGIINNSEKFNIERKLNLENTSFIKENYFDLCKKFKINSRDGNFFIVNKNGKIISTGKNDLGYEKGPKVYLQELIKDDAFSISEFIGENEKINDFEYLTQIKTSIESSTEKKYSIIALLTKICDSCSGGGIIQSFKKIHRDNNGLFNVLLILNRKYKKEDISNLRSQLKISFPIAIADQELNSKWDSLIERYNEDLLTDIIFIVDNQSNVILKVADRKCKCLPEFYDFLDSLIKGGE